MNNNQGRISRIDATTVCRLIAILALGSCSAALRLEAKTEVGFFVSGDTSLSYALDIPVKGMPPYPLVVIGHGSGPDTKDRAKTSARLLVNRGIAALRFDKRGTGDSGGVYERGIADFELLSGDLVAAVDLAVNDPRIDTTRIGLIGSSQAGWILPMVAARSPHVAFVILRSGPTVTIDQHNYWDEIADDESLTIDQLSGMLANFEGPGYNDPRPFIERMTMPHIQILAHGD